MPARRPPSRSPAANRRRVPARNNPRAAGLERDPRLDRRPPLSGPRRWTQPPATDAHDAAGHALSAARGVTHHWPRETDSQRRRSSDDLAPPLSIRRQPTPAIPPAVMPPASDLQSISDFR